MTWREIVNKAFVELCALMDARPVTVQWPIEYAPTADGRYVVKINEVNEYPRINAPTGTALQGLPFTTDQIAVLVASKFRFEPSFSWKELLVFAGNAHVESRCSLPRLTAVTHRLSIDDSDCDALTAIGGDFDPTGSWSCKNLLAVGGEPSLWVDEAEFLERAPRAVHTEIGFDSANAIGLQEALRADAAVRASAVLKGLDDERDQYSDPGLSL